MKVKIKLQDALAVLKKNLEEHIVEYREASIGWTDQVILALEKLRDDATRNGVKANYETLHRLFYSRPVDNRAQYSRFIGIIELAAANDARDLEIDETEYAEIFNDDWDWRRASKIANSSYTSRK